MVCAVTDLTSENPDDAINFPLSAQPATKHLYASRYYMENGSKLTIQNCVRQFDCTFDVKQGATLVFDDYPTHFGKEDHSFINDRGITRFKIQTLGGAVLRNFADVQYLQNGDITQTIPLHYKAMYEIYAGRSVDPDTDVPQQDYIIRSGADVTMQAGTAIYLEDGFTAEYGSNVTIDPLPIGSSAAPCYMPPNVQMRMAAQTHTSQAAELKYAGLAAYPNPSDGKVNFHKNFLPYQAQQLEIRDVFGRVVWSQQNFNSMNGSLDLSQQPSGIYTAVFKTHGKITNTRFVIQK